MMIFFWDRANGRHERIKEMIKFIDGFVALSKVNEPNVINIDAFNVSKNHQNTRKIVFNSQNKVMCHCHLTTHRKTCGLFWREKYKWKKCDYMTRFSSLCVFVCVCGDMTMTWGEEEDAEPDIGQRNRNRMDLNQSPFVMAFVRMLMSYDRYRMMLIIIFVVTTTFSRRRSALLYTKYIVREKEEKWIFLKQLKHVLSLHSTVGICYIGCGSGKLVS